MLVKLIVKLFTVHCSEGHDRTEIGLPGNQTGLIAAVAAASKGPVVLVVMTGGPVDISAAKVACDTCL